MNNVGILDIGLGNLQSVASALQALEVSHTVMSRPEDVGSSRWIVLPGVANVKHYLAALVETGWDGLLRAQAGQEIRVLGICAGAQVLFDSLEEGGASGLGLIPGQVVRLPGRRPNIGWRLVPGLDDGKGSAKPHFYFNHGYHLVPESQHMKTYTSIGPHGASIVGLLSWEGGVAVQFHPEKSHRYGMRLLRNFLDLV